MSSIITPYGENSSGGLMLVPIGAGQMMTPDANQSVDSIKVNNKIWDKEVVGTILENIGTRTTTLATNDGNTRIQFFHLNILLKHGGIIKFYNKAETVNEFNNYRYDPTAVTGTLSTMVCEYESAMNVNDSNKSYYTRATYKLQPTGSDYLKCVWQFFQNLAVPYMTNHITSGEDDKLNSTQYTLMDSLWRYANVPNLNGAAAKQIPSNNTYWAQAPFAEYCLPIYPNDRGRHYLRIYAYLDSGTTRSITTRSNNVKMLANWYFEIWAYTPVS